MEIEDSHNSNIDRFELKLLQTGALAQSRRQEKPDGLAESL